MRAVAWLSTFVVSLFLWKLIITAFVLVVVH